MEDEALFQMSERPKGYVKVHNGELTISDAKIKEIAAKLKGNKNGIIVCGKIADEQFANAVTALAEKLEYPILADPLSQLRSGTHSSEYIIDGYDTFLRNEDAKEFLKAGGHFAFRVNACIKSINHLFKRKPCCSAICD